MNRIVRTLAIALAIFTSMTSASPAKAEAPYSEIVVFGDSTVDTGNVNLASGGAIAGPPYFSGRFSNGPVWVEVLAEQLGLEGPSPSLIGGSNYAWGGAETADGLSSFDTPNLGMQVDFFLEDRDGLTGDELVVIAAGANDIAWKAPYSPRQIARNIAAQISRLAAVGGTTFLVPTLPEYGFAPSVRGTHDENRMNTLAVEVNKLLNRELPALATALNVTIVRLDVAQLIGAMLAYPEGFGLANVIAPACPGCGIGIPDPDAIDTLVPNPDEYLWWDFIHWTWVVHDVIGQAAADSVLSD